MPLDIQILGKGVYTPREAARLVGTSHMQVLRWTRGSGPTEPLFDAYYQALSDEVTEISFLDLIEVRVVSAMRKANISLQSIRFAISYAQEKLGVERPLASRSFKTDGSEILMDALENDGELISLSKARPGQKVFRKIVQQSLNDLEYENGIAARWRPRNHTQVVLDPNRHFGDPILDEYGISTAMLCREMQQFGDAAYLSRIYEIPKNAILKAVDFERSLDEANG
ncbi:hypothetical protein [Celeribacter sp.]|uniref:hypothetical protein n=1 Tax=Celeribacter sp. TaxID=1890673 RepID=UPI003A931A0F